MNDRLNGCIVIFDKNYEDEDADIILRAISMIKGVQTVNPNIVDGTTPITEMKVRQEIKDKLYNFIENV